VLADAPRQDYYSTFVYYDSVQPGSREAASTLVRSLGQHVVTKELPPEIAVYAQQSGNPLTVVVVGASFGGEVVDPAATEQAPPPKQPPHVQTFDGRSTLEEYHTPFRMYAPSVIASGSNWTTMEPVRSFRPSPGKKELVMTFVTGAGNVYYQVIETNWTDAPILRSPTDKIRDRKTGRRFNLYTQNGNIHLIAFRKGHGSYWVVNTLRDELSNETMLAIARGLRPLSQ
jgi:hypothetical protein